MAEPGFTDDQPRPGQWFEVCACGHSWMQHDADSLDGDNPSCCYETCPCGPGSYFVDQSAFADRTVMADDPHGTDWVRTIRSPRPVSLAAWWRCARRGEFWWPGKTFTIDLSDEPNDMDRYDGEVG